MTAHTFGWVVLISVVVCLVVLAIWTSDEQ